jgi:hypothetical protein
VTIPRLELDNRKFDDLVEELRALIPRYAPEWTNHNLSEPGITLIELFCWVAEGLIYRTNRIPEASQRRFLELLGIDSAGALDEGRAAAVEVLKGAWRGVTALDFEELVLERFPEVARVRCLADRALDAVEAGEERIGHVSVIVVPRGEEAMPFPSPALQDEVYRFLDDRRLITCLHHVGGPLYTDISLECTLVCNPAMKTEGVRERAIAALKRFFAPVAPAEGAVNQGWTFGRAVHESEVYAVLEGVEGVDHVETLTLRFREGALWSGGVKKISLGDDSLVFFDVAQSGIAVTADS